MQKYILAPFSPVLCFNSTNACQLVVAFLFSSAFFMLKEKQWLQQNRSSIASHRKTVVTNIWIYFYTMHRRYINIYTCFYICIHPEINRLFHVYKTNTKSISLHNFSLRLLSLCILVIKCLYNNIENIKYIIQ